MGGTYNPKTRHTGGTGQLWGSLSESQVNSEGEKPCCKAEKQCGAWGGREGQGRMSLNQENGDIRVDTPSSDSL